MVDCEDTMLSALKAPELTRDIIALTYAFALRSSEDVDFGKVNRAIMDRWSVAGLEYIKRKAWKLVDEKRAAHTEEPTPEKGDGT